jgi:hypothetical protein
MLDETEAQRELQEVSKFADKNQRLSWRRKRKRIDELITRLGPFQEKKLELILSMQPIMDDIEAVRTKMIDECVHPLDHLIHKGTHIECKFCNSKIKIQNG